MRKSKPTQLTQTSLKRLQDVLKRSRHLTIKQDVITTSGKRRRIYNVLKMSDLCRLLGRPIYDVLKTSNLRRFEDVQFTLS